MSRDLLQTYLGLPSLIISDKLTQKCQEILERPKENTAAKKEDIKEKKAHQVKVLANERSQWQAQQYINQKRHSNKHYQTMIFRVLERMKRMGMNEHDTAIKFIQYSDRSN